MSSRRDPDPLDVSDAAAMNRVLRHRLRNHSAGMKMTLGRIQDALSAAGSPLADRCVLMLSELDNLEQFTRRLDLAFGILADAEASTLLETVSRCRRYFVENFPYCDFVMQGEEADVRLVDGPLLLTSLKELLANAGEACSLDGRVSFEWELHQGQLRFAIGNSCDNPMPSDIPLDPPKPFRTTRGRHDGLGLVIVRRGVDTLGGKLSITQSPDHTVRAALTLPLETP
jgi:signal transduction histidine kinase